MLNSPSISLLSSTWGVVLRSVQVQPVRSWQNEKPSTEDNLALKVPVRVKESSTPGRTPTTTAPAKSGMLKPFSSKLGFQGLSASTWAETVRSFFIWNSIC